MDDDRPERLRKQRPGMSREVTTIDPLVAIAKHLESIAEDMKYLRKSIEEERARAKQK
jgi:hypothetical protein